MSSIASVFIDFYQHFRDVLIDDDDLTDEDELNVPAENIQPSFDPDQAPTGNQIDYGWSSSSTSAKAKRAEGILNLRVRSEINKMHAQQVLARIREIADARSITNSGADLVTVHLFKELPSTDDEVQAQDDLRYIVSASFQVKLVSRS